MVALKIRTGGSKPSRIIRLAQEWRIYALAFVFVVIADSIGQIKIPVGKGTFILFPIFYAIILGVCSGPQVLKLVDNRHVKAASKLVVVGIAPFIAKMGITAGSNIDTILNAGPGFRHLGRSQYQLYRPYTW